MSPLPLVWVSLRSLILRLPARSIFPFTFRDLEAGMLLDWHGSCLVQTSCQADALGRAARRADPLPCKTDRKSGAAARARSVGREAPLMLSVKWLPRWMRYGCKPSPALVHSAEIALQVLSSTPMKDSDRFRLIASRPNQVTQACYDTLDLALLQGRILALDGWYVLIQERPDPGHAPLEIVVTVEAA